MCGVSCLALEMVMLDKVMVRWRHRAGDFAARTALQASCGRSPGYGAHDGVGRNYYSIVFGKDRNRLSEIGGDDLEHPPIAAPVRDERHTARPQPRA